MKLQCQIDTVNRLLPTLNIRSTGKYIKSTLALGKEPKGNEFSILHFSSTHKNGVKYRIKNNIKQIFVKCINEGKATLSFIEPPHNLCIRADSLQLKCFMKVLKQCLTDKLEDVKLPNLVNVSAPLKNTALKKLIITNRNDFPAAGMPRTLESVYINGIKMCNFRREILLLRHLTVLDISNNEILKLPSELGNMPNIQELNLSNNLLGVEGDVDWRWLLGPKITKSLRLLDLSFNRLNNLTKSIWKLNNLVTLKLDDNFLFALPQSIGRIKTLKYLSIENNQIYSLPISLLQIKLEYLNLSDNKFNLKVIPQVLRPSLLWDLYVGNLVRLAGQEVIKYKLFYSANIIPYTLVDYLDFSGYCVCGKPVLDGKDYICKEFQVKNYFNNVILNNSMTGFIYFDCNLCSSACFKSLNK